MEICWSNVTVVWEFGSAAEFYTSLRNSSFPRRRGDGGDDVGDAESPSRRGDDDDDARDAESRMEGHAAYLSVQLHEDLLSVTPSRATVMNSLGTFLASQVTLAPKP
jgi:hypothetical protein